MIEEEGRVVTVEEDFVWVETVRKSTCSSCTAKNGCGQHLADKYRSKKRSVKNHSYIRATHDQLSPEQGHTQSLLKENDKVVVGIPETALIKASVLVYLLPLLSMMGALWLITWLGWSDLVAVIGMVVGLVLGFIPVKALGSKTGDMCRVKVVRVISEKVIPEPELIPVNKSWSA